MTETARQNSWLNVKKFDRSQMVSQMSDINWNPSGKVTNVVGTIVEAYLPVTKLGAVDGRKI